MTMEIYQARPSPKGKRIAAIDIGSHTTRMLVAEYTGSPGVFSALARRREYTRLAEGFNGDKKGNLSGVAVARTAETIRGFVEVAGRYGADTFVALSTGVTRWAQNKQYFLDKVKERTGLDIKITSGEREALLTRRGVIYGSGGSGSDSRVIFDLGGATTEFIWGQEENLKIKSLPIGALVMTQDHFHSDPPGHDMIGDMSDAVDSILSSGISVERERLINIGLTGSGGTATTMAAIIHGLGVRDIIPERINGMVIDRERVQDFFSRIRAIPLSRRKRIKGMEQGRAGVIIAGVLAVLRIMHYFNSKQITVSYSDILEGIVLSHIMEEDNE